ncbi:ABC transporter F family member 4-like [Hordeum vulgare subsp. vulgare]|uniref:FHA domain-containing protein n=1 Tax=Hordeum vulgare subsp. vulgare TaxID=112509 RepID=A0A8I7B9P6_HORVV|nr:ABC transporter F family member 4-like [Hordeum vulgare subsp. vulgare]
MAAPPPMLTLAVEKGPREGETRQCSAGAALRVGRVVKGNDLAVRDGGASQQHLVIEFLPPPGAGWAVSDLGSSNGTLLNGNPLVPSVPAPLSHGDLIKVGDSTVLAVSIAPDSDPKPIANPTSRRSSRQTAAVAPMVAEEKPPAVTRRGALKKAPPAAQHPNTQKADPEAEGVAVDEKPQVVTRRKGRRKLAAAEPLCEMEETVEAPRRGEHMKPVEPSGPGNGEVGKEAEATVVTRRGRQKNAAQLPEPEKAKEEATVVTRHGRQKNVVEPSEPEKEEEEKATAVTRRGRQKNAVEPSEPEKEEKEEATAVMRRGRRKNAVEPSEPEKEEEEKATAVTHRGRQKNAVEPSESEKEEKEEVTAVTRRGRRKNAVEPSEPEKEEKEEATAVTRRGRQKNVVEPSEPEKEEEEKATAVTHRGRQNVAQAPEPEKEKEDEAAVVTRRGRQKNVVEPPKPEKEEEEALVVTNRRGRKKNVVTDAPPPLPPKMRSVRGLGKKVSASDLVLEDGEEQGGNELALSRVRPVDLLVSTTLKGVKVQKRDKVASGDGDVEGAAVALEEKVPKGRASARLAASDNGANASVDTTLRGGRKKAVESHEPEKEEEEEAMVVTRRGRRKKNMEPHEPVKEAGEEKEDKAPVVMQHGATKKNVAPVAPASLPPKRKSARGRGRPARASAMNTVLEDEEEEQGGNTLSVSRACAGKLLTLTTVKKGDEATAVNGEVKRAAKALEEKLPKRRAVTKLAASNNISYVAATEPTEEMEQTAEALHHGGQKAMEHPELEKDEDATMVTHRGERKRAAVLKRRVAGKKDEVAVTKSGRGRGMVARTSARNNVLEENMVVEKENELAVPREQAGNLPVVTAVNGGEDREVKGTTKALEDELPKGRASAQFSSDNKCEDEQGGANGSSTVASAQSSSDNKGGANGSSRIDSGSNGIPNTTSKYREDRKLKPYSTPFDVRLDRALQKYSA